MTQAKKDKMFENNIDFDIIRKHCKSEAVKTFMGIDAKAILKDIITTIEDGGDSLKTIIEKRSEVLGYVDIIDKKYAGYCVITDLNIEYSPKLKLYALANGNTIPVKIDKKTFKKQPLARGDIIKVNNQCKKPKMKKVDGKWTESDEKEWWVIDYENIRGDFV